MFFISPIRCLLKQNRPQLSEPKQSYPCDIPELLPRVGSAVIALNGPEQNAARAILDIRDGSDAKVRGMPDAGRIMTRRLFPALERWIGAGCWSFSNEYAHLEAHPDYSWRLETNPSAPRV
jgi:hypothetical protein